MDGTSVSSDFSNNGWNFVPLDKNGEADWDYVPNLYVFSEDTGNGANYVSDITSQNTAGCFAGYWLTPHLTAKAQVARSFTKSGGGSADEDTPVEKDNCPWIHGMLSVDHIAGSPSSGGAFVKYYDPDWNGNQWDYLSATYDVYKVVS